MKEPVILAILLGVVLVRRGAAALVGQPTLKPSLKSATCKIHLFIFIYLFIQFVFIQSTSLS